MDTATIRAKTILTAAVAATQQALAADPLDASCAGFQTDAAGNVTGLKIAIIKLPGALYGVYRVHVRGTLECQGNTNVYAKVLDVNNVEESTSAIKKLWPYPSFDAEDSPVGDGNGKGEFEITSKFRADLTIGPLGFGVYTPDGTLISDVVVGFGQAMGYPHVSGDVVFRRLTTVTPEPEPGPGADMDLTVAVMRIADVLERWAQHGGV
jgi:hypothetical protein